jgi:hypothetical protein
MTSREWAEYGMKLEVLENCKETATIVVISNGEGKYVALTAMSLAAPSHGQQSAQFNVLVGQKDWKKSRLAALNVVYNAMFPDVDANELPEVDFHTTDVAVETSPARGSLRLVHSAAVA